MSVVDVDTLLRDALAEKLYIAMLGGFMANSVTAIEPMPDDAFDRADGVDSHRSRGDNCSTRLDADLRTDTECLAGVEQYVAPLGNVRRLLTFDVGNTKAATEHEFG